MKKLLLYSTFIVLLSGCATVRPVPKSIAIVIDYSILTNKGIFVTESNSVSFDYEAVGSVFIEETGGWIDKNVKMSSNNQNDDSYYNPSGGSKIYESPSLQMSFNNLADKLESIGANGIINLNITSSSELNRAYNVYVEKITITGMAIKKYN